jgi:hypothetical protein
VTIIVFDIKGAKNEGIVLVWFLFIFMVYFSLSMSYLCVNTENELFLVEKRINRTQIPKFFTIYIFISSIYGSWVWLIHILTKTLKLQIQTFPLYTLSVINEIYLFFLSTFSVCNRYIFYIFKFLLFVLYLYCL